MSTQNYYKEKLGFDPRESIYNDGPPEKYRKTEEVPHGYEENLTKFKDERDAVQKKTFTKWVNKHLKKARRSIRDLFEDLRDGHNLISLLEVLTGEQLPREKGQMRFHMLHNIDTALHFLRCKNVKLVNIRSEDIVDGNPKLTLGLIWTIILHFQFKEHFRMTRGTCKVLIGMFRNSRHFPGGRRRGKPLTSPEAHILSFLWFAGNKTVLRSVADRFNVSPSTLHAMMTRVMKFLLSIAPNVIRFPNTDEEKHHAANEFANIAGFPGVVGCVDGTYINIRTPARKIKSTYTNRHDTPSLTLQGICDVKRRFIDVFTGTPSKIHDSRVFQLSFIMRRVNQLGADFHILGDSAYPLQENLLTPYRDYGNLNPIQKSYNYKFSATRVRIENTFGLLKGRFRQLLHLDFHKVLRSSMFIISCCVLHNICIDNEDTFADMYVNIDHNWDIVNDNDPNRENGINKRDNIAQLFYNN